MFDLNYISKTWVILSFVDLIIQANAVAASLVEAAQASEVSDAAREHAQAALNGASANLKVVTDDYLHMAGFQQTPLAASPFGDSNGIQGIRGFRILF